MLTLPLRYYYFMMLLSSPYYAFARRYFADYYAAAAITDVDITLPPFRHDVISMLTPCCYAVMPPRCRHYAIDAFFIFRCFDSRHIAAAIRVTRHTTSRRLMILLLCCFIFAVIYYMILY